ncbi:unnamed protein product (mitochondrion) [Plasmodiophora brassicae]|uniref:Uncharacterized protein n=1 Tax=Plasmodiophora brassicae TaxID=37360 RepID=A0A3P3YKU4_PLABS|nr:unnamed protein product [Plasmodiophora brassicae]
MWRDHRGSTCPDETDLISQAVMTPNETESLARKLSLKLYRVCTKENKLVDEVLQYLSEQYLSKAAATGASANTTATKAPPTPSKAGSSREMPKSPVHDVSDVLQFSLTCRVVAGICIIIFNPNLLFGAVALLLFRFSWHLIMRLPMLLMQLRSSKRGSKR